MNKLPYLKGAGLRIAPMRTASTTIGAAKRVGRRPLTNRACIRPKPLESTAPYN